MPFFWMPDSPQPIDDEDDEEETVAAALAADEDDELELEPALTLAWAYLAARMGAAVDDAAAEVDALVKTPLCPLWPVLRCLL